MPDISFDFQAYVAQRKGSDEAMARTGAAYAYPGDQRVLRMLGRATPVTLAVEATVRLWKNVAKNEILGTSVKVTDRQFPEIYRIADDCASRLHIPMPTLYVAPQVDLLNAFTYGTEEDSYIVLNGILVDHLSPEELRFVIGHECGHIQNNHVVYLTALHYLMYSANLFVRWIVAPARVALQSWSRRAEVTCDRAGLLCAMDLEPAVSALAKLALGSQKLAERLDVNEYLRQLEEGRAGAGRILEIFRSHPYLPKRVAALRTFAETHYYLKATGRDTQGGTLGKSLTVCDREVRDTIAIFGGAREKKEG
jgi:Zn-dependent protease with chaperone function